MLRKQPELCRILVEVSVNFIASSSREFLGYALCDGDIELDIIFFLGKKLDLGRDNDG